MAQRLRALVALAEVVGCVPITHVAAPNHLSVNPMPSSDLFRYVHVHAHTYTQTHTCTIKDWEPQHSQMPSSILNPLSSCQRLCACASLVLEYSSLR